MASEDSRNRDRPRRFICSVMRAIRRSPSSVMCAPEDSLDELECEPRRCGLGDRELVLDLPAEEAPAVAHHRDREAAFAVNEPDYPLLDAWPFLLIVRTGRIVTVHFHTLYDEVRQTVPTDPRGFQHIAD